MRIHRTIIRTEEVCMSRICHSVAGLALGFFLISAVAAADAPPPDKAFLAFIRKH